MAGLLEAVGSPAAAQQQHDAVVAVGRAHDAVQHAGRPDGPRSARLRARAVAIEAVLDAAMAHVIEEGAPLDPRWGAAVHRLAEGAGPGDLPTPDDAARARRCAARRRGYRPSHWWQVLRRAAARHSLVPVPAARIAIAVAIGVAIGRTLGLNHGYWVGLSAASILRATDGTLAVRRAGHRTAGTALGVVLAVDPGVAATIAVVTALQFITELLVGVSYGPGRRLPHLRASTPAGDGRWPGHHRDARRRTHARHRDRLRRGLGAGPLWRRSSVARLPAAQAAAAAAVAAAGRLMCAGASRPARPAAESATPAATCAAP